MEALQLANFSSCLPSIHPTVQKTADEVLAAVAVAPTTTTAAATDADAEC